MAAPPSIPIEVRKAKYDALWRRLLAPPPAEQDDPQSAPEPTDDERGKDRAAD